MLRNREIRLSIRDRISDLFTAPPAATGLKAFNVYGEDDFRDDSFVPVFPYVYLIDSYQLPTQTKLPVIVIEIDRYTRQSFELGNRSGRHIRAFAHVFGKNRAERDDLAGFIADYFGNSFTIKTYTQASPSGTAVETVQLADRIDVEDMTISGPVEGRDQIEMGGSIINWSRVALEFDTKL